MSTLSTVPRHSAEDTEANTVQTMEKRFDSTTKPPLTDETTVTIDAASDTVATLREKSSILSKLRAAELWLDRKLNFEAMGVERVLEDQRRPPRSINMMLLWFSLLTSPGLVTIGALGPLLGLSLADSVITTVVGTCFGSIFPALMATISPVTGLRQIAVSRYAFGIQGAKLCSFLNIVVNIGYGIIGSIVAGQILGSVSGGSLDLSVGIVIVIVVALVVSFLGYHILQHYESVAWIFVAILLVVNFGQAAKYFPSDITHHELQGKTYTGVGLTYFAIVFGQCVAWSSVAGDYYVHYPVNVNKVKLAIFTWLGMTLPTLFVSILGCYLGAAILTNAEVGNAYETGGFGAAILTTMHPAGYAKFVGVIYTFSFIGNITAILYSSSLALQLFGKRFLAVPRFIWVILMSIATLALSLGGRNVFEAILENLLPLLGYWTICFAIVLLFEHFIFRPRVGGYDLDGWQDSKRTPLGLAGVGTLLSAIALSFLGMNQTWYSGPLAKLVGDYGGDVGDYVVIVWTILVYPVCRSIEIKYVGR